MMKGETELAFCRRKANEHRRMAGMAAIDGDSAARQHHVNTAREYEAKATQLEN